MRAISKAATLTATRWAASRETTASAVATMKNTAVVSAATSTFNVVITWSFP